MNGHDAPLRLDDIPEDRVELSGAHSALSSTFFPGANRGYLVDLIRFLLEYDPQLLVVTGARGVGKTVLLSAITDRAPPTWRVCSASACTLATPQAMFIELLRQLELPAPGAGALNVASISERLYKLQRGGYLPVLLLDDVQVLRNEVIEAILALAIVPENQTSPPLRIALFGVPALAGQVAALNQAAPVRYLQIPAFDDAQAKEYVAFRRNDTLEHVERILAGAQLDEMMIETEGLPAKINQWMDQGGTVKLAAAPRSPGRGLAWLGAAALAALLASGFVFQERISEVIAPLVTDQAPAPRSAEGLTELPPAAARPLAQVELGVTAGVDAPPAEAGSPEVESPEAGQDIVVPESVSPVLEPASTEPAPAIPDTATATAPAGDEAVTVTEPEPPNAPVATTADRTRPAAAESTAPSRAMTVMTAAAAPSSPAPEATAVPGPQDDGIRREAWIQAQHQDAYTLRIMSVRNEAALKEYVKDNNLLDQVAYYTAWRSTGAWYVLVYGVYPSEAKALEAMREVDARLGIKKPLSSQFKELQEDIRKSAERSR